MDIVSRLSLVVKDCPDFPRKGILFKDIMPIFNDPELVKDTCQSLIDKVNIMKFCGIVKLVFKLVKLNQEFRSV